MGSGVRLFQAWEAQVPPPGLPPSPGRVSPSPTLLSPATGGESQEWGGGAYCGGTPLRSSLLSLSSWTCPCLLGSRRSQGCYHCPDFHSRPQVLISCIIHLPGLVAVISSLLSPYGAPRPFLHVPAKQS